VHTRQVAEYARRKRDLADYEKTLPAKQAAWEESLTLLPSWTVLEPTTLRARGGAVLKKQPDGSVLATGKNPSPVLYSITAPTRLTGITGVRLEVLPDPSLPAMGPGRAPNGNFVLNEFRVTAGPPGEPAKAMPVRLHKAVADFSQEGWPVAAAIDGNPETGWAVAPEFGQAHVAVFEAAEPFGLAGGTDLTFALDQRFPGRDHNIGRLRLAVTTAKPPLGLDVLPAKVAQVLAIDPDDRSAAQSKELTAYYESTDALLASLRKAVADYPRPGNERLPGAQDLAWALLNSPEFLFNH
jgi:hypothetical protein